MKKIVAVAFVALFCFSVVAPVWAGGDQNNERHRGDKGQGSVIQNQNSK